MKKYKNILLGLVIGIFLVFAMGSYDKVRFTDDILLYFGTDNDTSMGWDATNSEFDITTTGEVKVTCSAVSDGAYGMDISGAIAGATTSEGCGAYIHSSITGNVDSDCYNLGAWMDITGGTPSTAGVMAAIDCGVYESGATLTNAWVVGLQIQTMLDSTNGPAKHYMMRFNTSQSGDTPDGWFQAANSQAVAYTAGSGTSGTKDGAIKINIVGRGDIYIRCYDSAS